MYTCVLPYILHILLYNKNTSKKGSKFTCINLCICMYKKKKLKNNFSILYWGYNEGHIQDLVSHN